MTLPEIPDDAVLAVLRADGVATDFDQYPAARGEHQAALEALAAAWPFLYGAALRHAADEIEADRNAVHVARAEGAIDDLRRMADEATP